MPRGEYPLPVVGRGRQRLERDHRRHRAEGDIFYRLYGDVFGTRNVTALDYSRFKSSLTTYNPIFDNYNTGSITALDYALFKKDLSIDYSSDGFVTTI